ncbi:MAG: hypothetical protein NTU73_04630, partial [Ignavibacteriae bacterium]|nr:hypothetical protein [Ignavibacteriota bacterium]
QRNELKSKNITQKILELKNYRLQLESFISNQKLTLTHFTPELVNKYKSIINSSLSFQKLIKEEGVIKLKDYKIANVASQEWRDFIDSARKYVSTIEKSKENYKYPTKGDRCIFCLQPISDDELKLINSYWNLFKSEAESQLSKVNNEMREIYKVIKNLPLVQFDETVAIYNYIAEKDLELAEKWKEIVLSTEKYKNNLKTDFKNKNLDLELYSFSDSLNDFDKIIKNLDVTIKDLYEKNTEDEIKKLDSEIEYLSDKNLLNKLFDKILLFISSHKWAEKAEKALSALNTKSITIKQGELFTQHITDKYTENFNLECENLRGPN